MTWDEDVDETDEKLKSSMRLLCLIKGRLIVRVGNNKFPISEGGVWRVTPGEKCIMKNQERDGREVGGDGSAKVQVCVF